MSVVSARVREGEAVMECRFTACAATLRPQNAATNFTNPALSVKRAIKGGYATPGCKVIELGSGNLRNAMYTLRQVAEVRYHAFELPDCIGRFRDNYAQFESEGGIVLTRSFGRGKYDLAICTFVLETICPSAKRAAKLERLARSLGSDGILVASFRGYPGVRGSKYRRCPAGEGLISPLRTFVKPYSVREAGRLLSTVGLTEVVALQSYRVDRPQNVHLVASRGD